MTAQERSSAVPADPYPYAKPNFVNIKCLYYKIWMLLMNDVQLEMICSITELTEIGPVHVKKVSLHYFSYY